MTTATHQYDKVVQVVIQQEQQKVPTKTKIRDICEDFSWYRVHVGNR